MTEDRDRVTDAYEGRFMPGEFSRRLRDRIHWMCRHVRGRRVLDVGCSQGIVSLLLGREGMEVVGIDIDERVISEAREALAREPESVRQRVRFLLGDLFDPSLDLGRFDTIICGQLLEHFVEPRRVIQRCRDFLNPGGTLIITVPFGYHPHPDHRTTFYPTTLLGVLHPEFRIADATAIHLRMCVAAEHCAGDEAGGDRADWRSWLEFCEALSLESEERLHVQIGNLKTQVARAEERIRALESQLATARQESQERALTCQRLQDQLQAAQQQTQALESQLATARQESRVLRDKLAEAEKQLRAGRELNASLEEELRQRKEIEVGLRRACFTRDTAVTWLRRRLGQIESSTSYRLGHLVVQSLVRPHRLLLLPFQIAALLLPAAVAKLRRGRRSPQRLAECPISLYPIPALYAGRAREAGRGSEAGKTGPDKGARSEARGSAVASPSTAVVKLPAPPPIVIPDGPVRRPDLSVAAILDEFSWLCFKYECNLLEITPANWRTVLSAQRPAFLFVESAWQGNRGAWRYMITTPSGRPKPEFIELVEWCRRHGIPTVFWNKEDPPNFELFIEAAKLFDYVFTTDANCVPRYKQILGHDRVWPLPFAAQPRIHNPIEVKGGRIYDVGFAGAWYGGGKHPERAEQAEYILGPALSRGLHIYDRNYGLPGSERYRFPDKYARHVVGRLDYPQMLAAQKQYKVFLNVNSVPDSPTMFSRRVFELLASGTLVVSAYAEGIARLLGDDLVPMSNCAADTERALDMLLRSPELRDRLALRAQRKIFAEHTYAHRLEQILDTIGIKYEKKRDLVSCVVATNRPHELPNVLANYKRQAYEPKELVIILNNDSMSPQTVRELAEREEVANVRVFQVPAERPLGECLNLGIDETDGPYWTKMDDDNFYATHFLTDLMNAFLYVDVGIVGKTSYYAYLSGPQIMAIRTPGYEHRYVNWTSGSAMIVKREVLESIRFPEKRGSGEDTEFLRAYTAAGGKIYSTDRFNYVCVRHPDVSQHTWQISDQEYLARCQIVHYGPGFDHAIV